MSLDRERDVVITIGNKTYSIETGLDEKILHRVLLHIEDSMSGAEVTEDQEKALLLACLDLAYKLESSLKDVEKNTDNFRKAADHAIRDNL